MKVVDTSFLIAMFDASDPRQAASRHAFEHARPAVVPTEVLVETLGVLKVKAGRRAATKALESLLGLRNVAWSECCDFQQAVAVYRRNTSLSFPDAIVVQECLARGVDALTHDERQRKAIQAGL